MHEKKYMVLNKIYIELLKFVDFDFSEFSKIAKNRLNYISAKEKTVILSVSYQPLLYLLPFH